MPLHLLSPREVQVALDGDHADGGGLVLRVRGERAVWIFRYTSPSGKRRDAGFGVAHRDSIASAGESLRRVRERARQARDAIAAGRDPLDEKQAAREAARKESEEAKSARAARELTLARCARRYHETEIETKFNAKYAAVWIASPERHFYYSTAQLQETT